MIKFPFPRENSKKTYFIAACRDNELIRFNPDGLSIAFSRVATWVSRSHVIAIQSKKV